MIAKMHTEKIAHPVFGSKPRPTDTIPAKVAAHANTKQKVSNTAMLKLDLQVRGWLMTALEAVMGG